MYLHVVSAKETAILKLTQVHFNLSSTFFIQVCRINYNLSRNIVRAKCK